MIVDLLPALSRSGAEAENARRSVSVAEEQSSQPPALAYQPIIALETGLVVGLAASVRRRASTQACRPDCVASALAHACAEARYFPGLRISVRISARQLESGALLGHIDAALAVSGLAPTLLDVELSEIGRVDGGSSTFAVMRRLRDRGVGIVLGGFGAGGASTLVLRQLPFTAVKLDHRLVHALPFDQKACTRVGMLLDARRSEAVISIADAVETLAQRDFLHRRGCDAATGPLYSRPVPPERLAALLDYGVDTCSQPRSGSETRDDRAVPH